MQTASSVANNLQDCYARRQLLLISENVFNAPSSMGFLPKGSLSVSIPSTLEGQIEGVLCETFRIGPFVLSFAMTTMRLASCYIEKDLMRPNETRLAPRAHIFAFQIVLFT